MRKASLLTDLFLGNLVNDPRLPRNQQLYRAIQQSILLGQLGAGQQLPPSRSLAQKLGIARNTVLYAYERLSAEGYVHANTGSGTVSSDDGNRSGAPLVVDRAIPVGVSGPIRVVGMGVSSGGIGAAYGFPPAGVGRLKRVPGAVVPPHGGIEIDVGVVPTAAGRSAVYGLRIDYHSAHGTYRWVEPQGIVLAAK